MKRFAVSFFLLLLASAASAEGILSGRIYTDPAKLYVNQPFKLRFEFTLPQNGELQDPQLSGLPKNSASWQMGKLEVVSQRSRLENGKGVKVITVEAAARFLKPATQFLGVRLSCTLMERRQTGFFTRWQGFPASFTFPNVTLRALPLPDGAPPEFRGAIGRFSLTGKATPSEVRPGDLVTLTLDLRGKGEPGEKPTFAPPPDPAFKTYPVKETVREAGHIATSQVWIPGGTNAVQIGEARFCYFNPESGRYETAKAGPFKLVFVEKPVAATNEVVRVLASEPVSSGAGFDAESVKLADVNTSLERFLPLIFASIALAVAFFVLFSLFGSHPRLAVAAALAVAGAGVAAALLWGRVEAAARHTLAEPAEIRFAPSHRAVRLFTLPAGTTYTVLETAGGWTRIDSGGRRGWLPPQEKAAP